MSSFKNTSSRTSEFHNLWVSEFQNWVQKEFDINLVHPIPDGFEHQVSGVRYYLKFNTQDPNGYVDIGYGRKFWQPKYRDEAGKLDSRQLIAAHGLFSEKSAWHFDKNFEPKFIHEIKLPSRAEIIPAIIASIEVVSLSPIWGGPRFSKIQVIFDTEFGSVFVPINIDCSRKIVPAGCGSLTPGSKVLLDLVRKTGQLVQLKAIYQDVTLCMVQK